MKLLLYCTKAKPYLYKSISRNGTYITEKSKLVGLMRDNELNGKIVAECDFEVAYENTSYSCIDFRLASSLDGISRLDKSCLTTEQLFDYVKGKNEFYSICIKNLHIFDKPRDIRNYYNIAPRTMQDCMNQRALVKAPQNMCNAYDVYKNHYILISIKPEWLCKILNGEKTIEVRKKVLKEMR